MDQAVRTKLKEEFPAIALAELPRTLGRESARQWLKRRGVPAAELSVEALDRLRQMSIDAATPARKLFPGNILISRRRDGSRTADPTRLLPGCGAPSTFHGHRVSPTLAQSHRGI